MINLTRICSLQSLKRAPSSITLEPIENGAAMYKIAIEITLLTKYIIEIPTEPKITPQDIHEKMNSNSLKSIKFHTSSVLRQSRLGFAKNSSTANSETPDSIANALKRKSPKEALPCNVALYIASIKILPALTTTIIIIGINRKDKMLLIAFPTICAGVPSAFSFDKVRNIAIIENITTMIIPSNAATRNAKPI